MATVREHYDQLLADLYSWMLGDFAPRVETQLGWLRGVVGPAARGADYRPTALDLGAGAGTESIALARLGYRVIAVDASAKLAAEMRGRVAAADLAREVEVVESDLVAFLEREAAPARLVLCLGDTLTHLESPAVVKRMLRAARDRLVAGGKLVVTYRDLSIELRELDRFFLVRSDASRILTCFVEYLPERAIVHDIVHTRGDRGWAMKKSYYAKLRLPVAQVCEWMREAGFDEITRAPASAGLVGLVAR